MITAVHPLSAPDPKRIMARCDALAGCSELPSGLTRVFLSREHRAACDMVLDWMRQAGMQARIDAIGNVVGRYEGTQPGLPCLMFGSHLDTVRDAGKYDGMLGVVTAIDCVQALSAAGRRFPFAIEVVGFGDEEGVRFGATLIGSRAVAGTLPEDALQVRDAGGRTMAEVLDDAGFDPARLAAAARQRKDLHAYVELHIEQGPVLEAEGLPVGVVSAINGFSRLRVTLNGMAGHAGTVPMGLRRDALAAAAECVLEVERIGGAVAERVATVGRIVAQPGAINVIPGEASFTIDCRSPSDAGREAGVADMQQAFERIAARRGLALRVERLQEQSATTCADWLTRQLDHAVATEGIAVRRLPSGAGHDGMAMRDIADVAMLFVRCAGGISHNPAEAITTEDAGTGARVLYRFIEDFQPCR
jgi:allantoate deiminase